MRNTSSQTCVLSATASIEALDARQQIIRTFAAIKPLSTSADLVLSANAPRWLGSQLPPPGVFYAVIGLMGGERDNPTTGGMCTGQDEIVPASWRVAMLGSTWVVANHDPGNGAQDQPQVPALMGCLANFSALDFTQASA